MPCGKDCATGGEADPFGSTLGAIGGARGIDQRELREFDLAFETMAWHDLERLRKWLAQQDNGDRSHG
jgi:hypothetical protein